MSASTMSGRPAMTASSSGASNLLARGRTLVALLWMEIKRSQGYWLLPLIVGMGIYTPSSDQRDNVVLWVNMSRSVLESFPIPAMFTAALAAWLVGRDKRRRMGDLTATLPGSGVRRDLLAGITAAFWGVVGYAMVAAWFFGRALRADAWGSPDFGLVTVGAMGIVVMALIGVIVGRAVPGRFAPIVATAMSWLLIVVLAVTPATNGDGSNRLWLAMLSPTGLSDRDGEVDGIFVRWKDSLVVESLVWLLAVVAVLMLTLAGWRSRHWVTLLALAAALLVAGIAAQPLVGAETLSGPSNPEHALRSVSYTPVCEESNGFRVCVHPAYEAYLDSTVADIVALLKPVAGLAGVPDTFVQRGSFPIQVQPGEGELRSVGNEGVAFEVIDTLLTMPGKGDSSVEMTASQTVLTAWLFQQSRADLHGVAVLEWFGYPAEVQVEWVQEGNMGGPRPIDQAEADRVLMEMQSALDRFSALTPEAQRAWLEANWDALRAGELALEEMP